MVYGINTGYNQNYNYQLKQNQLTPNGYYLNSTGTNNIFQAQPAAEQKDNVADGKDDGSIGFFGAAKNFVKGVGKFIVSPFTDENGNFSLGKTLKSAAIAGLFIAGNVLTGGALTPILLTVGGIAGGIGMAKAGYNIATAETDAEAEAAWQSMGSSTATVAATVAGARSYAKSAAVENGQTAEQAAESYKGIKGTFKAVKDTTSDAKTNVTAGYKFAKGKLADGYHAVKTSYKNGTLKSDAKAAYDNVRTSVKEAYDMAKEAKAANKEAWADMSKAEKKEAINDIKQQIINAAKSKIGSTPGDVLKTAKNVATNPFTIGINANLGRQTIKPDFYSQLTTEQQAIYNQLPEEQKEELVKAYQAAV